MAIANTDKLILKWTDYEYELFKSLELRNFGYSVSRGFENFEDFVMLAKQIFNRRKSRTGKSLERHLCSIIEISRLRYETQVRTEGNKRPDFIFPSAETYHDILLQGARIDDIKSLMKRTD